MGLPRFFPPYSATGLLWEESYITEDVTLTTGGDIYDIASILLPSGIWRIEAQVSFLLAEVAEMEAWIGPASAAVTEAYTGDEGSTVVAAPKLSLAMSQLVGLSAPFTTVYLIGSCTVDAAVAKAATSVNAIPNATGISAVRVGQIG